MKRIIFNSEFFNIKDTLECGQVFRFIPHEKGYLVFSSDKCAYIYNQDDIAVISCEEKDGEYFCNYFDTERDYESIYESAKVQGVEILSLSAQLGKGIRILNQNPVETLFSFMISQNNNIPRIKSIIERLCTALGEEKQFFGIKYHAFPTVEKLANAPLDFYYKIGLGYRAPYIKRASEDLFNGLLNVYDFVSLETANLKSKLTTIYGVGPKVADCVALFGYHRADSFPVDTWIEKVYREDFNGKEKNRNKITEYFMNRFGDNAGYFQQYLFHYKRVKSQEDKK